MRNMTSDGCVFEKVKFPKSINRMDEDEYDQYDAIRNRLQILLVNNDADAIYELYRGVGQAYMQELQFNNDDLLEIYLSDVDNSNSDTTWSLTHFLVDRLAWEVSTWVVQAAIIRHSAALALYLFEHHEQHLPDDMVTILRSAIEVNRIGVGASFLWVLRQRVGDDDLLFMLEESEEEWEEEDYEYVLMMLRRDPAPQRQVNQVVRSPTEDESIDDGMLAALQDFIVQSTESTFEFWQKDDLQLLLKHLGLNDQMTAREVGKWFKYQTRHQLPCKNDGDEDLDYISHVKMSSIPTLFIIVHDNICFEITSFNEWVRLHRTNPITKNWLKNNDIMRLQTKLLSLSKTARLIMRGEERKNNRSR